MNWHYFNINLTNGSLYQVLGSSRNSLATKPFGFLRDLKIGLKIILGSEDLFNLDLAQGIVAFIFEASSEIVIF